MKTKKQLRTAMEKARKAHQEASDALLRQRCSSVFSGDLTNKDIVQLQPLWDAYIAAKKAYQAAK